MSRLIPLMAVMLAVAPVAVAQSKAIGRYNDWRVYTEGEGRSMVCFAAVEASDKAPKAADHGEVTFYVAAFKSGQATSQPSLRVGYSLRSDLAPAAPSLMTTRRYVSPSLRICLSRSPVPASAKAIWTSR